MRIAARMDTIGTESAFEVTARIEGEDAHLESLFVEPSGKLDQLALNRFVMKIALDEFDIRQGIHRQ